MNRLICKVTACVSSCAALALLAGCATTATPNYDARFGDAVRAARSAMTINAAPPGADPVTGIDAQAGREAIVRYQDSFKAPPPVVNVINIGGNTAK